MSFEDPARKDLTVSVESPTMQQIETAILDLDGQHSTMVVMVMKGVSTLTVGGGANNQCVVDLAVGDNEEFYTLADPNESLDEIELVSGGQLAPFQRRLVFDKKLVIGLVHRWVEESGATPQEFFWINSSET